MEALTVLTQITVILVIGIIVSLASKKLKIPNVMLLLVVGIILGSIEKDGQPLIGLPPLFITSISLLALVTIVFDASSKFNWREIDTLTSEATKLSLVFLFLSLLFLTFFTAVLFQIMNIYLALIFSALMAGTSADVVMSIFGYKSNRVIKVLELESIINTPLTVLLPFIIISIMVNIDTSTGLGIDEFVRQLLAFLQQFVAGLGAGVLVGIVIFKFMRRYYSEHVSALILITSALLTYILAENLGGSGVLAVTVLGLFFGNFYVKEKETLNTFSTMFSRALMILVFTLIGLMIKIPLDDPGFYAMSLLLFLIYIVIRFLSVLIISQKTDYSLKEKLFMVLSMPKGVAVGVIAFTLTTYMLTINGQLVPFLSLAGSETILHLVVAFMLYSIILSTLVAHFSEYFINIGVEAK